MSAQTLSITDNRTGATYEIPVEEGAIQASALRQIKLDEDDFGLMSYDPASHPVQGRVPPVFH